MVSPHRAKDEILRISAHCFGTTVRAHLAAIVVGKIRSIGRRLADRTSSGVEERDKTQKTKTGLEKRNNIRSVDCLVTVIPFIGRGQKSLEHGRWGWK